MKNCVKCALLCSLICTCNLQCASTKEFQAFADEWIATYVQADDGNLLISPAELNVLLNVTYFSYQRSTGTLIAQEYALKALNTNWRLLQNITQTRLNPAHPSPYKLDLKQYGNQMKQAWMAATAHDAINSTYSLMIEYLLEDTHNTSKQLRKAIEMMREQARAALVESLSAVKEYVEYLINECQKKQTIDDSDSETIKRGVISLLLNMLPPLAAHSFAKVDAMGIEASQEGWKVLSEVERIHNIIWAVLEQRRANFYAVIYRSLYAVATTVKDEVLLFNIAFDAEGPIAADAQSSLLPDPRKITLFE